MGQTYFAIQTYRQEVADRFNQLDEDSRRLVVRGDIKQWNQLIANLFRILQTEEKLRKDKVDNAETATKVHNTVGREVRKAIEEIGSTMPEDLPTPEKSIVQIGKEQMQRLKKKAKEGTLMLDE